MKKGDPMTNQQEEITDQYDEMVTKSLERLTRWAFPDSQVERKDQVTWQLWHTTINNQKYIDVSVELQVKRGKPESFLICDSVQPQIAELSREELEDALRIAICSLSE
jgi:hypothetical protein